MKNALNAVLITILSWMERLLSRADRPWRWCWRKGEVEFFLLNQHRDELEKLPDVKRLLAESRHSVPIATVLDEIANGLIPLGHDEDGEIEYLGVDWVFVCPRFMVVGYRAVRAGITSVWPVFRAHCARDVGAVVLCITRDGFAVLVETYRNAVRRHLIEPPGGTPESGEPLNVLALREANEEADVVPSEDSALIDLGFFEPGPASIYGRVQLYLLTNCLIVPGCEEKKKRVHKVRPAEIRKTFGDRISICLEVALSRARERQLI